MIDALELLRNALKESPVDRNKAAAALCLFEAVWEDDSRLHGQMAALLDGVALALKGEPKPLHRHDWSDLPEVAERAVDAVESAYSRGWSDRAAVEFDAYRDPEQLAVRLGVCIGALAIYKRNSPDAAADLISSVEIKLQALKG